MISPKSATGGGSRLCYRPRLPRLGGVLAYLRAGVPAVVVELGDLLDVLAQLEPVEVSTRRHAVLLLLLSRLQLHLKHRRLLEVLLAAHLAVYLRTIHRL